MRNQHLNTRTYEIPFDIIIFEETIELGVPVQKLKVVVENVMGSIMDKVKTNEVNPNRSFIDTKSLVFQNPPFEIDTQKMKIRLYKKIWNIQNVSNDFLTRGDVNLTIIYESDDLEENDKNKS